MIKISQNPITYKILLVSLRLYTEYPKSLRLSVLGEFISVTIFDWLIHTYVIWKYLRDLEFTSLKIVLINLKSLEVSYYFVSFYSTAWLWAWLCVWIPVCLLNFNLKEFWQYLRSDNIIHNLSPNVRTKYINIGYI